MPMPLNLRLPDDPDEDEEDDFDRVTAADSEHDDAEPAEYYLDGGLTDEGGGPGEFGSIKWIPIHREDEEGAEGEQSDGMTLIITADRVDQVTDTALQALFFAGVDIAASGHDYSSIARHLAKLGWRIPIAGVLSAYERSVPLMIHVTRATSYGGDPGEGKVAPEVEESNTTPAETSRDSGRVDHDGSIGESIAERTRARPPGTKFHNPEDAARAARTFLEAKYPKTFSDWEWAGWIYQTHDSPPMYTFGDPATLERLTRSHPPPDDRWHSDYGRAIGNYHTHPEGWPEGEPNPGPGKPARRASVIGDGTEHFSKLDVEFGKDEGLAPNRGYDMWLQFLFTPKGDIKILGQKRTGNGILFEGVLTDGTAWDREEVDSGWFDGMDEP